MWDLIAQLSNDSAGSWEVILRSYGLAAPPIFGLLVALHVVWKDRNAERARANDLTERLLAQQENFLPLTKELVDALRKLDRTS